MAILTQRNFYEYSDSKSHDAEILELRSPQGSDVCAVLLDRTIFYPEGGGQPGDRGTINNCKILDVREEGGEILHMVSLEDGALLKPGKAELILDASRRRDYSVNHTGQHLLSGNLLRLSGKATVSMHLGDEINTIDVDSPELSEALILEAEEAVMKAIEENHPVIIHLCPPEDVNSFPLRKTPPKGEELIRVIEIEGNDFSPCCGTHMKSTGEIGILRILGAEKYKGMMRVSFIAGRRCLADSRSLYKNAGIISRALKVPMGETGKGVLDYMEKNAALERQLKIYEEESGRIKAEALITKNNLSGGVSGNADTLVLESYRTNINEVLRIGRTAQKLSGAVFILAAEEDYKFAAFCGRKETDIRPLLKNKFEELGGRGGGGPSFFQGSFNSAAELAEFMGAIRSAL